MYPHVQTCIDVYRLYCPDTKAVSLPCSSLTLCARLLFAMLVKLELDFASEVQCIALCGYIQIPHCLKDRCHRKGCGNEMAEVLKAWAPK